MLGGSGAALLSLAFDAQGQRLVTGGRDGVARVFERMSERNGGRETLVHKGHEGPVNGMAFSADGARIATGSEDGTARVWDAATGRPLATVLGHAGAVNSVALSHDGLTLASGASDATLRISHADSGKLIALIKGHALAITSVALSDDGRRLLTGASDGTVRITPQPPDTASLLQRAMAEVPRHLGTPHLQKFHIRQDPPRWCITGAGLERQTDARLWRAKWPYGTDTWRQWLIAIDAGKKPAPPVQQ